MSDLEDPHFWVAMFGSLCAFLIGYFIGRGVEKEYRHD